MILNEIQFFLFTSKIYYCAKKKLDRYLLKKNRDNNFNRSKYYEQICCQI